MNNIYLIIECYDNGESYEDYYYNETPIRAFPSKEEAENYIRTMPVPKKQRSYSYSGDKDEYISCTELIKTDDKCVWLLDGLKCRIDPEYAIRAFALQNVYFTETYSYYISELPFGKEKENE